MARFTVAELYHRRLQNAKLVAACAIVLALLFTACAPTATKSTILVEWTTATEINTAGFNLYRSESSDGPFVKINPQLIPASNDNLVGGKYQFADTDILPGKMYYYQLEDIEFSGATTRHGPIAFVAPSASPMYLWLAVSGILGMCTFAIAAIWRGRKR